VNFIFPGVVIAQSFFHSATSSSEFEERLALVCFGRNEINSCEQSQTITLSFLCSEILKNLQFDLANDLIFNCVV
jgi:hypothetical protein